MALISAISILRATFGHTGHERGHPQSLASADREMAARARDIDRASVGETFVARSLGVEFGMSEEAIISEKEELGASWGDLTIAHTLAASDKQGMTAAQVLHLHDRGMGWGQIAAGLDFKLDDAVRAVRAESRVARGRARADGKTATIGSVVLLVSSGQQ
jgi:hypothetical protein